MIRSFLRSVAGTFGKRARDIEYVLDLIRWYRRERKLAKMKFPWYYMG